MTLFGRFIDVNKSPDALNPLKNQKALVIGANSEGEAYVGARRRVLYSVARQ